MLLAAVFFVALGGTVYINLQKTREQMIEDRVDKLHSLVDVALSQAETAAASSGWAERISMAAITRDYGSR